MQSIFSQLFSGSGGGVNVAGAIYGFVGEVATYTAEDGTITSGITLQIERYEPQEVDRKNRTTGLMQTGKISVAQAAMPRPSLGGRFGIGTEVWTIDAAPMNANGQYYIAVSRSGITRTMGQRGKSNA